MPRGREIMLPMEATAAGDLRLSGHYHHRQTILPAGGGSPIYVIGSLARLTFGEEGNEPGFQVYEIEAPPG
jgi:DNA repair exonuclease SbcCD nuclease subunit